MPFAVPTVFLTAAPLCLRHIVITALRSATSLGVASRYVYSTNKPSPQPLPELGSPASRVGHRAVTLFALASVHTPLPSACSSLTSFAFTRLILHPLTTLSPQQLRHPT